MARKGKIEKRIINADPVYNSKLITRMVNRLMRDGKKTVAEKVVYNALDIIKEKTGQEPLHVFEVALQNVGPKIEVKARRVGGASYQVPTEVRGDRKMALAIRWTLAAAEKLPNREYKGFAAKLAQELIAASNNEGEAIRKRDVVHKMAEANRAFAHFRF